MNPIDFFFGCLSTEHPDEWAIVEIFQSQPQLYMSAACEPQLSGMTATTVHILSTDYVSLGLISIYKKICFDGPLGSMEVMRRL